MAISAEKRLGHSTVFKQSVTTIAQIETINIPGYSRGEVDVTTLDSTIMDFIPGDPPEITEVNLSGIWVSGLTSQELLQTAVATGTNDSYSILVASWTTDRTATFSAYVTEVKSNEIASKNPMKFTARLRPTTVITWS